VLLAVGAIGIPQTPTELPLQSEQALRQRQRSQYRRLDSRLNAMIALLGSTTDPDLVRSAPFSRGTSVAVTVRVRSNVDGVRAMLESRGALVSFTGVDAIEAYVPVRELAGLDQMIDITRVETIVPPIPLGGNQGIVSQGAALHNALEWHAVGFTATGVKVGIIDIGFAGYSARLDEGEVRTPAAVRCYTSMGVFTNALSDCETGTPHGTAVAEAIVDIAPDATYYLAQPSTHGDLLARRSARAVTFSPYASSTTWGPSRYRSHESSPCRDAASHPIR
jgi:hypothetical protein